MLLHLPTLRSLFFLFLSSPTASLSFLFFPPCTLVVSLSSFHHTESYFCVVITGSRANHKLDLIYAGSALPPTYPSRRPLLSFSFSICSLEGVGAFAREPLLSRSIDYQRGTGGAFLFFFLFSFLFLRFQRNTSLLAVRRSRCIDRSPRDSPSIRALFRGFSEALDLEYSRHPSLQLCGRSSNLAVL